MLIPAGNYDSHTSKNEYSIVPNKRGVQIVGGGKTLENLISGVEANLRRAQYSYPNENFVTL